MKREHTHEYILWVVVMAVSLHVLEEYTLNFCRLGRSALRVNVSWEIFHLVNTALMFFGIACAMIGWRAPGLSLTDARDLSPSMPSSFHILLTLVQWRISPWYRHVHHPFCSRCWLGILWRLPRWSTHP
jgi:hypothetical protein